MKHPGWCFQALGSCRTHDSLGLKARETCLTGWHDYFSIDSDSDIRKKERERGGYVDSHITSQSFENVDPKNLRQSVPPLLVKSMYCHMIWGYIQKGF